MGSRHRTGEGHPRQSDNGRRGLERYSEDQKDVTDNWNRWLTVVDDLRTLTELDPETVEVLSP